MTTPARPGSFTGATDNAASGGLFTDTLIDGIPDIVGADVARAETAATNAETSATGAATSATNAATSETNAGASATSASTSATNAATSATNAATSASTTAADAATATVKASEAATSATNAASSETAAAGSATSASSSATSATSSANTAVTSASAAGTSETNAATSATNSANSATASANSASASASSATASANSATASQTAQTAAELAETNAETAETNAETAETGAATSATNAANSASAASTSETNAATSATNSANSATASATSATASANSATAAAASEAAAAGYVDNFDDKYLGAKTSDPTVDNDGDPLTDGALYYNTTDNRMKVYDLGTTTWLLLAPTNAEQININTVANDITNVNTVATNITDVNSFADTYFISATAPASPTTGDLWFDTANSIMKVYDGSGFVNAGSSVNGTSARYDYTATAGQTTFAAVYDTGYVDVYLNGVKLAPTDFTATNGSTIVLTTGAALNDTVGIVGYGTFSVASAVTLPDNVKATFGAGNDLEIYHNGSHSFITDNGDGDLYIRGSDNIRLQVRNSGDTAWTNAIKADDGAATSLMFDGSTKLATTASGINVTGTVVSDGLAVDGTAEIRSTGPTQLLIEDTDNGFAATTLSVENGGRDFHINTPQDIVLKQGGTIAQKIFTGGDISFYDNTGVSQGFYWDADQQSLGLGTTTPDSLLELYKAGTSELMIGSDNAGTAQLSFYEGNSSTKEGFLKYDGASNNVVLGTSGAANAVVVARDTGNVGIGKTPSTILDVEGANINFASSENGILNVFSNDATAVNKGGSISLGGNSESGSLGFAMIKGAKESTDAGYLAFGTRSAAANSTERLRILSNGNIGIATTAPNFPLSFGANIGKTIALFENAGSSVYGIGMGGAGSAGDPYRTKLFSNGAERIAITDAGLVGIGTASPLQKLTVEGTANNQNSEIKITASGVASGYLGSNSDGLNIGTDSHGIVFKTGVTGGGSVGATGSERMRIDSSGRVLTFKTTSGLTNAGVEHNFTNAGGYLGVTSEAIPVYINRAPSDGGLIHFRQNNNQEGSISVSGTTVSYNGGHLSRWSQLADNTRDGSIVKGTVMTNLDQMAEWTDEGVTEENEQLNCMAVSSVEGDANVAGVFVNWDNDDDIYTNDMNVAMTGDMIIRIAQGTTVARGDLLMSAGNGTAKPQGDDIVRSKTIAKVTSTNVSHIYDDGSYCVPCVLMAC